MINNKNNYKIPEGQTHAGELAFERLQYLVACQYSEYEAYQADSDYLD